MKYCLWSRYVTRYRKIDLLFWVYDSIPELIRSFIFSAYCTQLLLTSLCNKSLVTFIEFIFNSRSDCTFLPQKTKQKCISYWTGAISFIAKMLQKKLRYCCILFKQYTAWVTTWETFRWNSHPVLSCLFLCCLHTQTLFTVKSLTMTSDINLLTKSIARQQKQCN